MLVFSLRNFIWKSCSTFTSGFRSDILQFCLVVVLSEQTDVQLLGLSEILGSCPVWHKSAAFNFSSKFLFLVQLLLHLLLLTFLVETVNQLLLAMAA